MRSAPPWIDRERWPASRSCRRNSSQPRISAPKKNRRSVQFLQLDSAVVLLQDLFVARPVERHAVGADLAHAHAMSPAAAIEHHSEDRAGSVPLDIEGKKAVAQAEQCAQS